MTQPPSPNCGNGRDGRGRFALGNPGRPGNPHSRRAARLRAAMFRVVTPEDVQAVVRMLDGPQSFCQLTKFNLGNQLRGLNLW